MTQEKQTERRSEKPLEKYLDAQGETARTGSRGTAPTQPASAAGTQATASPPDAPAGEGWSGSDPPGERAEPWTSQPPGSGEGSTSQERRPAYGYYYASATRRIARRREAEPGYGTRGASPTAPYDTRADVGERRREGESWSRPGYAAGRSYGSGYGGRSEYDEGSYRRRAEDVGSYRGAYGYPEPGRSEPGSYARPTRGAYGESGYRAEDRYGSGSSVPTSERRAAGEPAGYRPQSDEEEWGTAGNGGRSGEASGDRSVPLGIESERERRPGRGGWRRPESAWPRRELREGGRWEERPGEWSREERPWLGADELGSRAGYGSAREAYGYGREGAARRIEIETAEPMRYPWGRYGPEWRGREWQRGWPAGRTRWQREPLTAGEVMTRQIKAVTRRSTLANVAEIMKDENCGIVPVVDETHKLLGLITDRDIVIRTLAEGKSPGEVTVEHVMTDDVEAVRPDEELGDVVELMGRKQIRRVPVVNRDDRLVGIISMGDIANRADYDEDLQEALEKISAKRSFWSRLWS